MNAGSGGATIAADDVASIWYQQVKLVAGTLGSTTPITAGGGVEAAALRVTIASDSTGVLSVDDNGGSLTVDNGGTFATQATLQAGTAEFGKLAAGVAEIGNVKNSGTFVVQENGAALTALQLIDNIVHLEDAASSGGDAGVPALVVRDDSLTTLTPADGDYTHLRVSSTGALHVTGGGGGTEYTEDVATANPIVGSATLIERDDALSAVTPIEGDWIGLRGSAEGALWVQDFNSDAILVDTGTIAGDTTSIDGKITACNTGAVVISSGTVTAVTDITNTIDSTISGDALTSLQVIDNIVHVDDAAYTLGTDSGVMMMGFAGTQSVNANDAGAIAMETDGAVHIHDGGNTITVDGTVTANPASGTIDTVTNLAQMGGVAISLNTGVRDAGTQRVTLATDDSLVVDLGANNDVTVTSGTITAVTDITNTIDSTISGDALTALQLIDNPVVAHDAAASGASGVSMAGGFATNSIEGLTQVAANDAARVITDLNGVMVTRPHTTLEEGISGRQSNTDGTEDAVTNFAAGGTGIHNYITSATVFNAHATTTGYVDLLDGTGGTILWTLPAPAISGCIQTFDPPLKQTTANTQLYFDPSAAITTIYVSLNGFQAQG